MSEFLGEASVLIVPDTSKFRATLEAELANATKKPIVVPVVAGVRGGTGTKAAVAEQTALAGAVQKTTAAEAENIAVAKAKAAADRAAAKAAAEHAAAQSQLARGAGATGLSLLGARGATLAAGNEFLIGAASVTVLAKAVQGAIEDEETLFRVQKVLGNELGAKSRDWAQTLANSFGITDDAALKFEGAIAETLHNVGLLPAQNAKLSQTFVELAADMAAFAHVPVEDTLKALQLAVSGNARSLRQFGVVIQNSEVQQRALARTGKTSTDELTRQELAMARIAIIFDRTRNQVGAFADNEDSLANKTKVLTANLDQLGDTIGAALIPALSVLADDLTTTVRGIQKLIEFTKGTLPPTKNAAGQTTAYGRALHFLGGAAKEASGGFVRIITDFIEQQQAADNASKAATNAASSLTAIIPAASGASVNVNVLSSSFRGLIDPINAANAAAVAFAANVAAAFGAAKSLTTLGHQLQDLQFQGASTEAQRANLEKQIAAAQAIIAHPGTLGAAGREKARAARNAAQAQIDALNAQDIAELNRLQGSGGGGGGGGESAADRAKRLADEADQRLLTEQQIAQTNVDIAKAKAQHTKSLVDDLKADRAQVKLLDAQIVEAQKIHDRTTRIQTIQQLILAREQAIDDIAQKKEDQRQARRDRIVSAAEAKVQSAQLDADLAVTQGNKKAQVAALERENAALEAEKKLWKGNTIKQKEIRNAIAENNKTIREIRGEVNVRNNQMAELAFSFLQAQQGFAATVMGNLLSGAAVAGSVANGAISTPTVSGGPGPAGFATAVHQRPIHSGVAQAAAVGASTGATAGQMSSLISISRGMLGALNRLAGGAVSTGPEARYWKYRGGVEMTGPGGWGG